MLFKDGGGQYRVKSLLSDGHTNTAWRRRPR